MDIHQAADVVASVSALMERFERRTQQIESSLQAAHHQLQQLAHLLPAALHQAADTEMEKLRSGVVSAIEAGIGPSVSSYESRLQEAGHQLQQASHALSAQIHGARQLHQALLWKITGVGLTSLALIVLGGSWLSKHYYDEIRRHQLSAELLKAYDAADVTLCNGKLCANVDAKGEALGDQDQYRPVRDRP